MRKLDRQAQLTEEGLVGAYLEPIQALYGPDVLFRSFLTANSKSVTFAFEA